MFIVLGLVSSSLIGFTMFQLEKERGESEALVKNEMLHSYLKASFNYLKDHQKPAFVELVDTKTHFYPEFVLGFKVIKDIWDQFRANNKDYDFKQATLDPLNQNNKANADEVHIINRFRQDPQLNKQQGKISKDGSIFYYVATPVKVWAKACLDCHGKPENASRLQIETYGTTHGYNWELGDIVTTEITYVSLEKALNDARSIAIKIFAISIGCFLATLIALYVFCL
jgi:hypothetical protein